jgi:glycosyltransferase involved in cell wall biosynthesis
VTRGPLDVVWLKSPDVREWRRLYGGPDGTQLPYRIDHLRRHGIRLHWSDSNHRRPWTLRPAAAVVRRGEAVGAPFLQTLALTRRIAASPVTLAMFESEGNFLAWLRSRRIRPYTRTKLIVIACWLPELLPNMAPRRLARYRAAYRCVDRLVFFSSNQAASYRRWLGLPAERLAFIPFGVDEDFFRPASEGGDHVLAVGRDRGRDWPTLLEAARRSELPVKILCRPRDLGDLPIPPNVEVIGYVDRHRYRSLLATARFMAIATTPRQYPSGQTVLLEAAAMGKSAVMTAAPASDDYQKALPVELVPPGDPASLVAAMERVWRDPPSSSLPTRFTASAMWADVADLIRGLADPDRPSCMSSM